jgi:hypothetical protein
VKLSGRGQIQDAALVFSCWIEKEHEEPQDRLCRGQDWKWLHLEFKSEALPLEPNISITLERTTGNPSETRTGYFWIQIYNVTVTITCLFLTLCFPGVLMDVNFHSAGRRLWRWLWMSSRRTYGKLRLRPISYCVQYCPRRNREKQANTTLRTTKQHTICNETDFSGNFNICNEVVWVWVLLYDRRSAGQSVLE